ncbi:MAG: methylated-DNA--[protein]-cysteine S-methyltransferase [Bacteroidales bacterium]
MDCVNIQYYKTPYGELVLGAYDNKLCLCDWRYRKLRTTIDRRLMKGLKVAFVEKENKVLDKTKQQLDGYFLSERKQFDIPLLMIGSDFQQKVWKELLNVSYGSTSSYLMLAEKIGNKNAVRAVANANGANAISIIIPCHRIVGSKGELVGYAGGLKTKEKLLQLENNLFSVPTSKMQYSIDF